MVMDAAYEAWLSGQAAEDLKRDRDRLLVLIYWKHGGWPRGVDELDRIRLAYGAGRFGDLIAGWREAVGRGQRIVEESAD